MISVIYRKTSYMTAVNDHCKQPSFFVVNDWGTAVYGRARSTWVIFLSDSTRFLSDSFRSESGPDFIGFLSIGIRQKSCRIQSVFYARCQIPMKSDRDPIENDRINRSDHLPWACDREVGLFIYSVYVSFCTN
jgi:hypothetical protein